jgi:hypothetical protein
MWWAMIVVLSIVSCSPISPTEPEHDRISQGAVQ